MGDLFKLHKGFYWPVDEDKKAMRNRVKQASDIQVAVSYCKDHRLAVQAGGNNGYWPLEMSKIFSSVYTFEPNRIPFGALVLNTLEKPNIYKFQAGLGSEHKLAGMELRSNRSGAAYVSGEGHIPILRIDDFEFPFCDLIYVDIEGAEFDALSGASNTIRKCKPVVAFEDKGLSQRFGHDKGDIEGWLEKEFHYTTVARPRHDTIMVYSDGA